MDDVYFEPPGAGRWALDRSHYPGGATPIAQWLIEEGTAAGMETVFAEIGVPARRIENRFVEGFLYSRLIPLVGADRPSTRLPPLVVLKLATRVHPAFRERNRTAAKALTERRFVDVLDDWQHRIRPELLETNRRLQGVDVGALSDDELESHVAELLDWLRVQYERHFYLHGHDLGPIARYLHHAIGWGLDPTEALSALAGASPSTTRPLERLVPLRELVDAHDGEVVTLDDVRAISPEAARLLDEHLADHGDVLATGYDITSFRLRELPSVVLDSIRRATPPNPGAEADAVAARLREQVPVEHRSEFDAELADARLVMDMRDDNGPLTVEWPTGLLRRGLLEAGRRLVERGSLAEVEHALDLTPAEARRVFTGTLPPAADVAARQERRLAIAALDPPQTLGPEEAEPPLDVMPSHLAELVAMVQTAIEHLGMDAAPTRPVDVGVGIGSALYTGTACVATSADDAFSRLTPGDVLVVRATSPAFNAVLTVAGAVVTANGGGLSHAAVLARELGIPAVVGLANALDIADGTTVTVDPTTGTVTSGP